MHKFGTPDACGEAGQTTRAGDLSGLVNVLSRDTDRGTFAVEDTSDEVEMLPVKVSGGEDFSWIGSFGEDTVEVNCAEGESPRVLFFADNSSVVLSRDSFADNSSGGSFAISSFGMDSF